MYNNEFAKNNSVYANESTGIFLHNSYQLNHLPTHWVTVTQADFKIPAPYTIVLSVFSNNLFLFLPMVF